jgi:hypothetical protein
MLLAQNCEMSVRVMALNLNVVAKPRRKMDPPTASNSKGVEDRRGTVYIESEPAEGFALFTA